MSNFDHKNDLHVMVLAAILQETQLFNTASDRTITRAESMGLVPEDLDLLQRAMDSAAKVVMLNQVGISIPENVLEEVHTFALAGGIGAGFVQIAKDRGLLALNDKGNLVYDESLKDEAVYNAIIEEVLAQIEAAAKDGIDNNNSETNDEDNEEGGFNAPESGDEFAEQEEDRDEGGDASVSAPVAA